MRPTRLAVSFTAVAMLGTLAACGGSTATAKKAETKTAAAPAKPAANDPLAGFNGKRISINQQVILDEFEYGVKESGVILKLIKIHEQEYKEPGRKKVVTTQAELTVRKGEEQKRVLIGEDEGKWALGCKINVAKARVEYLESRQNWLPRATVTVGPCNK